MSKSFVLQKLLLRSPALFLLSAFIMGVGAACSKSDDQKRFEEEAFGPPDTNIVHTDNSGKIINNNDPDDWQVSPMHQSFVIVGDLSEFQPPYPNPVPLNSGLTIELSQNNPGEIQALQIIKINSIGSQRQVIVYDSNQIGSNFINKTIPASLIADGAGSNASGYYRILIYDENQNIITYGDVRVQ